MRFNTALACRRPFLAFGFEVVAGVIVDAQTAHFFAAAGEAIQNAQKGIPTEGVGEPEVESDIAERASRWNRTVKSRMVQSVGLLHRSISSRSALYDGVGTMSDALSNAASRELDAFVAERRRLPTGFAAAARSLVALPVVALFGFFVVTVPRFFFDIDPLLGSPGYVLCPTVCADCVGPWRVVTKHMRRNNRSTSSAPRYFCPSPSNGITSLSDEELKERRDSYARYELFVAPAASTWLLMLFLFLPFALVHAWLAARTARTRALELDTDVFVAAQAAGVAAPEPPPPAKPSVLVRPLLVVAATVVLAVALIGLELAARALFASSP
jgi:hypothetical protein